MGSKALAWPLQNVLYLSRSVRHSELVQQSHISHSAVQRSSRQHAFRVNPNNRRGDEYGPVWPPMPSAATEDDGERLRFSILRRVNPSLCRSHHIGSRQRDVPLPPYLCNNKVCCAEAPRVPLQGPSKPVKGSLCSGNWKVAVKAAHAIAETASRFPYADR